MKPMSKLINEINNMGEELYLEYTKKYGTPVVIHAHNFEHGGLIAQQIKKNHKIPYILTEHSTYHLRGLYNQESYAYLIKCIQDSYVTTAVSNPFSKALHKKTKEPISILPNVIDTLFEEKINPKNKADSFTFLNIATLDDKKDHKSLFLAFSQLNKNTQAQLRIGGAGELLSSLINYAKELGIQESVSFIGKLSRQEVRQEMTNADCFVLSSKVETFGVVIIEAMACGTPVIATACGGPEDIISSNTGVLIEKENTNELSKAMQDMLINRKNFDSNVIRDEIIGRFGSKAFSKKAIELYTQAINDH
jgi:glycosyltransferase involved in cell wall biosynthesis